jgi:putative ABC transport system substrate-binding protein
MPLLADLRSPARAMTAACQQADAYAARSIDSERGIVYPDTAWETLEKAGLGRVVLDESCWRSLRDLLRPLRVCLGTLPQRKRTRLYPMEEAWREESMRNGKAGDAPLARLRPWGCQWRWDVVLVVFLVSSGLLSDGAGAAERTTPFRIGALTESWGPTPQVVGLRDGLLARGYRENEQFVIGVRFTQGDIAALPAAARELVQYGVDLLFVSDAPAAKAAQMATTRIPIVFAGSGDFLGMGLVQSFARPGGNITGVTNLDIDLGPKRLQVFQEIIPTLKRVLFPYDLADASSAAAAKVYHDAARRLGIELVEKAMQTQEEAQATLAQVQKGEVDGLLQPPGISLNIPGFIMDTTSQRAVPSMFDAAFWVEHGALASYGPDFYDSGRQAARLVDKILKGAKPAEIPVEVNSKIEFVINLKVAKALGLTIAPVVLYQANRLIQ